jgi:hypothetical protein
MRIVIWEEKRGVHIYRLERRGVHALWMCERDGWDSQRFIGYTRFMIDQSVPPACVQWNKKYWKYFTQ